jgi:hypothetical protein
MIKEHNVETGEIIERDLTVEELKQQKIDLEDSIKRAEALEDKVKAKLELLERLGITEEESQLLLG